MRILSWNINGIRSFDGTSTSAGGGAVTHSGGGGGGTNSSGSGKTASSSGHAGWLQAIQHLKPDIICIQETKVTRDNLEENVAFQNGYSSYFAFSRKRTGYSGVATFCLDGVATPIGCEEGLGGSLPSSASSSSSDSDSCTAVGCYDGIHDEFTADELKALDAEGRCVITQHNLKEPVEGKSSLVIINVYCPRADPAELPGREVFKLKFYKLLELRALALLKAGHHVVILGDVNTSHKRIDHCDPYEGFEDRPGRRWMSHFLGESQQVEEKSEGGEEQDSVAEWRISGQVRSRLLPSKCGESPFFVDTFRRLHPERSEAFTCWNTKMNCRSTNFGTRIDYVLASGDLAKRLSAAGIEADVQGSDHCPVTAVFDLRIEPSPTLPSFCTKNFAEFSGKQQKISTFFRSKTELTAENATAAPPPPKRQKIPTIKQRSISAFVLKKTSSCGNGAGTTSSKSSSSSNDSSSLGAGAKVTSSSEKVTSSSEKMTSSEFLLSEIPLKAAKNERAASDWKLLMGRGPPQAPLCKGHREPCVQRVVKKAGANQGRKFWVCHRGEGKAGDQNARCDFFQWMSK